MIRLGNTLLFIFLICYNALGQEQLDNPYEVIYNHLDHLQNDNYQPTISARSFPISIDSLERIRLAKNLKYIYDGKGLFVKIERLPKDPFYRDSIAQDFVYFPFPEALPDIYVEKVNGYWRYSENSVKEIPNLFRSTYPLGLHRLLEWTPTRGGKKILGLFLWQYLGILLFLLLGWMLYFILSKSLNYITARTIWRSSLLDEQKKKILHKINKFIMLSALVFVFIHLLPLLRFPIRFSSFLQNSLEIILTVFLMLVFLGLVDVIKVYLKNLTAQTESRLDEQLLPILTKFGKITIVIIAIFRILGLLDVNVTALIAGISIGGLALALAAQDTVKNLFGSMMIFFDKPFQIGDYIIAGDVEGSVTEVGFRSTRVKKPDTSILTVPNARIVDASLTNLGIRNFRMMQMTIGLMYNTPVDKITSFITELRGLTDNHPKIFQENKFVFLKDLGSSSIDIFFRVYIDTKDFVEELSTKEEIIFNILRIAESVGVSFAFPSTSVYIEEMPEKK